MVKKLQPVQGGSVPEFTNAMVAFAADFHPGSTSSALHQWSLPHVRSGLAIYETPLRLIYFALQERSPRAARCLLSILNAGAVGITLGVAMVDYAVDDHAGPVLAAGLAGMPPPAWPPPSSSVEKRLIAIMEGPHGHMMRMPLDSVVELAGCPPQPGLAAAHEPLSVAVRGPLVMPLLDPALTVLAAISCGAREPIRWPIRVDDSSEYRDEVEAFLAFAAEARGDRMASLVATVHRAEFTDTGLIVWTMVGRRMSEVHLSLHRRTSQPGYLERAAVEAAWGIAFDIVNEPTNEQEVEYGRRWFGGSEDALLVALRAYATPPPAATAVERIAWELSPSWGRLQFKGRRQRPKKGSGWTKGTEVDPSKLLSDASGVPTDQDRRVAAYLASTRRDEVGALQALVGHPLIIDADGRAVSLSQHPIEVVIDDRVEGGHSVSLRLDGNDLAPADIHEIATHTSVEEQRVAIRFGVVTDRLRPVVQALLLGSRLRPSALPRLEAIADTLASGQTGVHLPRSLQGQLRESTPRLMLRLALTDPCRLTARVGVVVGDGAPVVVPGEGHDVALGMVEGQRVRYQRDLVAEVQQAEPLRAQLTSDLAIEATDEAWDVVADDDAALQLLQRANACGAEVVWRDQRRLQVTSPVQANNLKVRVSTARQWLGLDGEADVDGDQVSLAMLLAATRAHRRYVKLADDRFAVISDELREGLRGVAALTNDDSNSEAGVVEVPFAVAHALDGLHGSGVEFAEGEVWRSIAGRLEAARAVVDVPPVGLSADLRPYQRDGVLFLRRLAAFGTGGVLADDMGLGKTVQAIGLLVDRAELGPAVVVAPTSLVFNWVREIERFAPSLRPHVYGDASDRGAMLAGLGPRDVLVLSYGLVDDAPCAATPFSTAIFDEAQAIKNAETQRARACRDLNAPIKIALSGTPLENHLGELWSLFRVTCPGLLGSAEQFRKRFLLPIEKNRSSQHRRQLGETLRPFMLRRTKAEVLTDLPPLTHQLVDVESAGDEKRIYEALRLEILSDLDDGSTVIDRRFRVLAGLTRLRLCCCHPVLVEPTYRGSSAKLDEAIATLVRVKEAGHRALVFSQFVKFLDIVEPAAAAAGLSSLRLDGSTPEVQRRQRVDAFQRGEADVFFLSLKAGGAGLNLTNADVVVHLDPWWNPAVEAQAIARAHRMGRADPVTAIRIVVRGTIEEAILKLHDDKRELVDAVLAGASSGGTLSLDEIASMLGGPPR